MIAFARRASAALLALALAAPAHGVTVEAFSPQGEVKGVRQVAARFTAQIVPFGDPRLVEPFDVSCPENGTGRWADGRNWVYDFARDLPAGVVCTFSIKPGLKTLAGESVEAAKFSFSTGTSRAALPLKAPLSTGYAIKRTVAAVEQKTKGEWTRGDVYRVTLEIEAQSDMTWVVVSDPIPAGAAILGTGLGRDSQLLTQAEKRQGWVWPAFEERSFEAFRAYYELVPKGKWTVEYTARLNNEGSFDLPSTRVEAMCAPEMFGEIPNAKVVVKPR